MENFVVEFCPTRNFFDSNDHDLSKLEKPDLILRIIELTKENEDLKRKLKEIEDTSYTSDKERLSSLGQELEALKIKLNEKSQSISASTLETIKMHEHSPPSSVSINSKDEEREQEEKAKTLPEIEKNASPPNRNIEDGTNKNSSTKSPSMVLMEQDAEYYKKFMTTRPARNSVESRVWTKEILVSIRNKEPREKILGQIQHSIQDFIPKKYRGEVWPILIGNPLRMKRAIYDQLCKSMESFPVNDKVKSQIKEDLVRTYPELKSFSRGNALNEDLQYLLELFHFARPDIGYVQGISYPASILLLYMDSYHAFKCLMNLIVCRPFLTNLYRFKLDEIRLVCKAFDHLLKQRSPLVQKHLERMNISPEVYLIEWLVTLFCRNFHIDDTANIWDMFLLEGEVALVKVALKIFQMIEPELIRKDYAETLYYLRSCTDEIDMERLFKNVQSSQLTQEKFRKLVEKEKNKKKEGIKNIFGALFVKPIM